MKNLWRRLRLRYDDWCGLCRLCQQPELWFPKMTPLGVPQRYDVDKVSRYDSAVLQGCYHAECAMAAREARYIARHTVTR